MKQRKTVNVNVKIKLSRIPSSEEKRDLVETIAHILDNSDAGLYDIDIKDGKHEIPLFVDHHFVTIRKMGK